MRLFYFNEKATAHLRHVSKNTKNTSFSEKTYLQVIITYLLLIYKENFA